MVTFNYMKLLSSESIIPWNGTAVHFNQLIKEVVYNIYEGNKYIGST